MEWNEDDRLVKVKYNVDHHKIMKYDIFGRLLMKNNVDDSGITDVTETSTKYYYDGISVLMTKEDVGTGYTTDAVFTLGAGVAGHVLCETKDGNNYWYQYDRLGNVTLITDDDANIEADCITDSPFGVGASTDFISFGSKLCDWEIGLAYFYQRWYDFDADRFISQSPMPVFMEHPYAYCEK